MNTLTLQPTRMVNTSVQHGGPTMAHMACAFAILIAASVAFVVMFLWPVVARFV